MITQAIFQLLGTIPLFNNDCIDDPYNISAEILLLSLSTLALIRPVIKKFDWANAAAQLS